MVDWVWWENFFKCIYCSTYFNVGFLVIVHCIFKIDTQVKNICVYIISNIMFVLLFKNEFFPRRIIRDGIKLGS